MKKEKFRINKTTYIIFIVVFALGIVLEIARSDYVLRINPASNEVTQIDPIQLPKKLTSTLSQDTYLIITNPNSIESMTLKTNILQTLHYMQKKGEEKPVSSLPVDYKGYSGVIVTFEELNLFQDLTKLEAYVEGGGNVFFAIRPGMNDSLYRLYRKLGIYDPGVFTNANGVKMTSNLLIQSKGMEIDKNLIVNSSLSVGLEQSCHIYMESINHIPLLWDVPYKNGKFIVFNGTMLSSKENRGLLASTISLMKNDFIYPIMNMKLAFIDDFPAPFPKGMNEKLYKEYNLKIDQFFRNIWWPEIQSGAAKYDMKYAGVMIETYNNLIHGPFDVNIEGQINTVKYGRDLLKMGGEIGLHGYNHQPLTTNPESVADLGYNNWKSQKEMSASLTEVVNYAKEAFPALTMKTYVPPSNIIDEMGLSAIDSTIPSIKVISSLYIKAPNSSSFAQEFTVDGRFINLPRVTSGYEFTEAKKWVIANAVTSLGVFSHFIHPDDILDEERSSSKSWEQLSKEYNSMLSNLKEDYPWLKSRTPTEGASWLEQLSKTTIYTEEKDHKLVVYIDQFPGEIYFILRTNKRITGEKDCAVDMIDEGVYLVTGKKEIIEIGLGG